MTTIPRRTFLATAAALPLAAALPAHAATAAEAEQLVRQATDEITQLINSGATGDQLYEQFEAIFAQYADVPTIARYSLGVAARQASSSQLDRYEDAFAHYIARKYGRRFREFIGGDLEVRGSRAEGQYIIVNTTALLRGEPPFAVDFLVSDRSGSLKFFNVIIEGVNMLTTERTEIGAQLDRAGSIDALIDNLAATGSA